MKDIRKGIDRKRGEVRGHCHWMEKLKAEVGMNVSGLGEVGKYSGRLILLAPMAKDQ